MLMVRCACGGLAGSGRSECPPQWAGALSAETPRLARARAAPPYSARMSTTSSAAGIGGGSCHSGKFFH
jgi:hypothetical protein